MKCTHLLSPPLLAIAFSLPANHTLGADNAVGTCNAETIRKSDTGIIVGLSALTPTMDPLDAWHYLHFVAIDATVQTIVTIDDNRQLKADLALRWTIDTMRTRYTFHLDPKALFSDGTTVTSHDVAISLSRHFWPDSPSSVGGYLKDIILGATNAPQGMIPAGIATPTLHTIQITLRKPYPLFLDLLALHGFGILKADSLGATPPISSGLMQPCLSPTTNDWILINRDPKQKQYVSTIVMRKVDNPEAASQLLKRGKVDILLGFADPILTPKTITKHYHMQRLQNFGTLHLYFNNSRKPLNSTEFRIDLAKLIRGAVSTVANPGYYVEPHFYFIPFGIMPHSYYRQDRPIMSTTSFRKKWNNNLKHRTLRICLRKEYLSADVIAAIQNTLKSAGIRASIESKTIAEMIPILKQRDYDMALMGYFGVLSDPDGFLDPIKQRDAPSDSYGVIPTADLFQKLDTYRHISNRDVRLQKYADALNAFENQAYFLPLFRLYFPAIIKNGVHLPDAKYRFDLRLSQLRRD